jgi:hypothetical protein
MRDKRDGRIRVRGFNILSGDPIDDSVNRPFLCRADGRIVVFINYGNYWCWGIRPCNRDLDRTSPGILKNNRVRFCSRRRYQLKIIVPCSDKTCASTVIEFPSNDTVLDVNVNSPMFVVACAV